MGPGRGQKLDRPTREQFLKCLHHALTHLYDADHLRRSPLAGLLGVADQFDTALALRQILTEAIESLKPKADGHDQPRGWEVYEALLCCYVQRLSQQVVADQLGMSTRQLRRELRRAWEALADQLWQQFDLEARLGAPPDAEITPGSPSLNDELAWLKTIPPDKPTNLSQALLSVLELARPLAAQHGVALEVRMLEGLPELAVHPVALDQILLNLLCVAIPRAPGKPVSISARLLGWEVEISLSSPVSSSDAPPFSDDDTASLDMARRLTDLCRGRLTLSGEKDIFEASLTLPALEQLPVLVIDDNPDTLQLLQRYASGTRYRLIGAQDPEQALGLAEKLSPQLIVLDVMMPQVDGWRMLERLRHHPRTGHIPILVCTILAQEKLALSLGASAFIKKPVTRQAFLAALDQQIA